MTRSTSINNSELRKMSTPIPISVNTWQMRSPHQYLNTEDSNQFDPGIMEHCISQNSISPSSAASHSFSPVAYNNNNLNNINTNPNPKANPNSNHLNNPSLNTHINIYVNQPHIDRTGIINLNSQDLSSNTSNGDNNNDTNNQTNNMLDSNNIINQLNQFTYENYPSVDLSSANDLFGDEDANLNNCNLVIENDLSVFNSNIYDENDTSNVSLPVDLESLLINTTLSDHSSQNVLISTPNVGALDSSEMNDHRYLNSRHHHDDASDEQNVNNNINPMFLFNKPNNIGQFNNQNQTGLVNNVVDGTDFNNNTNNEKKFIKQSNKPSPILSQAPNSHQQTGKLSFRQGSYQIYQRKIDEEGEEAFIFDSQIQPQQIQLQYDTDQHNQGTTAISLPTDSNLPQNFYNRMNQNQTNYGARNINEMLNAQTNQQISDPVLTQVQLNNNKSNYNMNNNLVKENVNNNNNNAQLNQFNASSNSNNTNPTNLNNRKISYLLSQQNLQQKQQQQQQQLNMIQQQNVNSSHVVNNVMLGTQSSTSMSLPTNAYSNFVAYETARQGNNFQQIKQEPKQFEDNDEKFSKLKLSSPESSSTTSNSSSSSSSSANLNNQVQQSTSGNSNIVMNRYQDDSKRENLESIINSDMLNSDDVMLAMTSNQPTSSRQNQAIQQCQKTDMMFDQMNKMVENSVEKIDINEINLASDDQTVIEECFKFSNELVKDEMKSARQQGRPRRRTTVSFSKVDDDDLDDDEEEADEDDDDEDYYDDEDDDTNACIQFNGDSSTNSKAIAIGRRRSNRSMSGTSNKLSKSFSAQQSSTKRRQINNQLCVGSVGSSSHLYMMQQQQRIQVPLNSRKHARTSELSLTNTGGGVDVHSSQQTGNMTPVHMTSSNSKDMFSNLQFSPFLTNQSNQQNFQMSPQHQTSNTMQQQQQPQSQPFLSSSLPATHSFDSMMMILNNNNNSNNQNNAASTNARNNHPNLNKLLLNSSIDNQLKLPVFSNNQIAAGTAKPRAKLVRKKQETIQEKTPKKITEKNQQKKRPQKKQELFDDSDDDDEEEDSDYSDDDLKSKKSNKKSVKMEDSDFDDDSTEDENTNDSNDCLNTTRNSVTSAGSSQALCQSTSSSFVNSESLFDLMMSSKNRDAYFWQYNIQSKGPKTKKVLTLRNKDPHLHRDFFDPVFQLQSLNARGGTAVNKLRKGDGNDVTPNADKLYNLGNQIRDFIQKSYQMNSACFSPLPPSISTSSLNQLGTTPNNTTGLLSSSVDTAMPKEKVNLKREKNKIASRACRLKKKAQHEANKIKLFGLNDEHKQLLDCISSARELIRTRLTEPHKLPNDKKMIDLMDEIINQKLKTKLAGNSDGYVHMLMLQVEKDRANNRKSGILDLNNLNKQFALFQQHEKQLQQQQEIKLESNTYEDQGMEASSSSQPFMFNENTLSPKTPLQF